MLPGVLSSDSELIGELLAASTATSCRSDGRDLEIALAARAAPARRRVLARAHGRSAPVRRPRPQRLPSARARPHRGRLGARERDGRARHRRRALRARRRARRAGRDRRERRPLDPLSRTPTRSCASSSSSTSPAPTRISTGRSVHAVRQRMGEELARQAPVRRRHGDARPRVGCPCRAGLRARVGHPVRRRLREEPLRRAHVHPAEPEANAARTCG